MNFLHPGGTELTDAMIEACGFKAGDKILDLGCGDGSTSAHLREKFGLEVIGADTSEHMVMSAKAAHPDMEFVKCDGISLDFSSNTFDGAIMECSFSLMPRQEEILHELYCVLKKGAHIAISDLCMIKSDMERAKKNCIEAQKLIYHHREDGECTENQVYPSPFCLDGMFVRELLLALLEDTGFIVETWVDRTQELRNYAAQLIMSYGSFEEAAKAMLPAGARCDSFCKVKPGKNTGYFSLSARKA